MVILNNLTVYIQWIPAKWDTSGLEYIALVKRLQQIYGFPHKGLKMYMHGKQKLIFGLLSNKNTDYMSSNNWCKTEKKYSP
jgi:hypothetical protein